MEGDIMTREEMQRFIDLGIDENKSEVQIFRDLRKVLGLKYEPKKEQTSTKTT